MSQKSHAQLARLCATAAQKVTVGAHYTHYKDDTRLYEVLGLVVIHATKEVGVHYRAEFGPRLTFVRPLTEWLAKVPHEGQRVLRFQKIDCSPSLSA